MAEAEKVVVELIVDPKNFNFTMKTAATNFGASMKNIETTAAKAEGTVDKSMAKVATSVERSAGAARQATRNLGYQISDISTQLAGGQSPFLILAQQGPQVANALDGAKGKIGQFATFLSGPWGAALLGATTLLGVFGSKLFDSGDEAKKSSNANELFADKLDRTKHSLDEVIAAVKEYNDQQAKAQETTLGMAQASAVAAAKNIEEAVSIRKKLEARLADAKLSADIAAQQGEGEALAVALRRVNGLQGEIDANTTKLHTLEGEARSAVINVAEELAKLDTDPTERIKTGFQLLRNEARSTIKDVDELRQRLADLNRQEEAALKRQRELDRPSRKGGSGQIGRQVSASEAASIASAAGLQVNSSSRSYAQQKALHDRWVAQGRPADNPVAAPGSSAHEGAKGRWALDIQFGQGVTPELLKKVFADQGVSLSKVFKERGHFHVEGSTSQADSSAAEAKRAVNADLDRKQRVANEEAGLDDRILSLKATLANSAEQDAALELQRIQASQDLFNAEIDHLVATGKVTDADAYILQIKNDQASDLQRQIVEQQKQARIRQDALTLAQGLLDNDIDTLRSRQGLANTQKERRTIALAILDAETEKLRLSLEDVVASKTATEAQKEIASRRLAQLDEKKASAAEGIRRDTASPIEGYMNEISMTGQQLDEELQRIAAGGLRDLTDGIADAIVNFHSLGDVAKAVLQQILASLIKLVVQQLILNSLGFLGFSGGGSVGSVLPNQAASTGVRYAANGGPIGFPGGGAVYGPGSGTSDSIPARLSNGEYVIRAKSAAKLGRAMLDSLNMTGEVPAFASGGSISMAPANTPAAAGGKGAVPPVGALQVNITLSEDLNARIDNRAAGVAVKVQRSALPQVVDMAARETFRRSQRPTL